MSKLRVLLIALLLLVAALAAGFLGGRLPSSGQGGEIETLKGTIAQLSQTVEKLKAGMVAPDEFQNLGSRVASLEEELQKEQATTSGQGTEIETLKGTISQLSQTIEKLKAGMVAPEELQGLSGRVTSLEEDLHKGQAFATEQGTEIETLKQTIAQLSQKLGKFETAAATAEDLQSLVGRVATLEEGLQGQQAASGEQGTEIETLKGTIAQLSQTIEKLKAGMVTPEELQSLADRVATLEEERQNWEGRFEELAAKVEAVAERKFKMGYVDIAAVYQRLRQSGVGPGELESRIQEVIRQIGEEGGYDLIIQENSVILYPQAESITDLTDQVITALEGG